MLGRVSGSRSRSILIAAWYVASVIVGAIVLWVIPQTRQVEDGPHTVMINEFGEGAPITQVFQSRSNGLNQIDLQVWAEDRATLTIEYRLSLSGASTAAVKASRQIRVVHGLQSVHLEFPEIDRSGGSDCILELRALALTGTGAKAKPAVALVASRDRPRYPGHLTVGADERWGMLRFEATATGDSVFGRFEHLSLPHLPALLRVPGVSIALLLLYSALFVPVALRLRAADRSAEQSAVVPRGRVWVGIGVCLLMATVLVSTALDHRPSRAQMHLMAQLHDANISTSGPLHQFFDLVFEEIDGVSKPAIFAHSTTRVIWHLTVPPHGKLRTWTALSPSIWASEGDGVVFRVQVVDAGQATEVFWRHVDPHHDPQHRRWMPVEVDLWRFAGHSVDLVLVTEPSLPALPPDSRYDRALWGDPTIGS